MAIKSKGETRSVKAQAPRNDKAGSLWQMKKRGCAGVSSPAVSCGYDKRTLDSLKAAGWHLYRDGEKVF